jgi:hypothetical protein
MVVGTTVKEVTVENAQLGGRVENSVERIVDVYVIYDVRVGGYGVIQLVSTPGAWI